MKLERLARAALTLCLTACDTGGGVANPDPLDATATDAARQFVDEGATPDAARDAANPSPDGASPPTDGAAPADLGFDGARPSDAAPPIDGALPIADAALEPDAAPPEVALRVATWNLHCVVDDWPARLPRIADTLAGFDPDVMLLQEICVDPQTGTEALPELLAALSARTDRDYESHYAITHQAWDRYDEGVAIVSAVGLVGPQVVDLPPGLFPRKAIGAQVTGPEGSIRVVATHLSFGDQAEVRARQLASIRDTFPAHIIGGDLNQSPDEGPIAAAVAAGYVDSWAALHPNDDGFTYRTTDRLRSRIDYILVGGGLTPVTARRMGVAPVPSDHLGVVVDVAVDDWAP